MSVTDVTSASPKYGLADKNSEKEKPSDRAEELFLLKEQTTLLYKSAPYLLLADAVFGLFTFLIYWNVAAPERLLPRYSALFIVVVRRALFWRRYRTTSVNDAPRVWANFFVISMATTGVIWGSAVFPFLSGAGSTQDEFLLFMLAGLTTGTIASSASYVPATCAFIIPILFPVSFHYMLLGPRIELAMGLVILFAMGVIIRLAINAQATIIKAMRLRHRNAALVSSLETRQGRLESKSAFLQAVLDNIRQGVSVFDKDLKLTAWNQAFLDIPQPPEE